MTGMDALKEYRANKSSYLPMVDHETKCFETRDEFDDVNIGWNCGFIGNRPYFAEVWATTGITMLTVFISTIGIEDYTPKDLERLLIEDAGYYAPKEGYIPVEFVPQYTDDNGNEFFSVNVVVGEEDEPAVITGARAYPFTILNELNGG